MDWKCKSSGMSSKMRIENLATLSRNDVLKFVVGSTEDLTEAEEVVDQLAKIKSSRTQDAQSGMPHIYVSPVFGTLEYQAIVEWLLSSKTMTENKARFQVQLHKVVWDPDKRGV
jgi:7-carboxy-7-deazaguanine synthase